MRYARIAPVRKIKLLCRLWRREENDMKMKFHHIALAVKNFDEVVAFYKDGFGLKVKNAWDMNGTDAIMLSMDDGGIIEIFGNGTCDAEENANWIHLCVAVDDVDAAYNKALELGATSRMEPATLSIEGTAVMPVRIAFVYGLAGEVIEFFKEL